MSATRPRLRTYAVALEADARAQEPTESRDKHTDLTALRPHSILLYYTLGIV